MPRCSGSPMTRWARASKPRCRPSIPLRRPIPSPRNFWTGCETGWRTTNVRGRSPSRRNCPAPTPASCTRTNWWPSTRRDPRSRRLRAVAQPQRQRLVDQLHEFVQPDAVLPGSQGIDAVLRERDAGPEQPGRQYHVAGVVFELTVLRSRGQLPAFESDGVDDVAALLQALVELGAVHPAPLQPFRPAPVDVIPGPVGSPAFEPGIVEQDPIIKVNSIFEWAAIEIDHLARRPRQQVRQCDHRRVR